MIRLAYAFAFLCFADMTWARGPWSSSSSSEFDKVWAGLLIGTGLLLLTVYGLSQAWGAYFFDQLSYRTQNGGSRQTLARSATLCLALSALAYGSAWLFGGVGTITTLLKYGVAGLVLLAMLFLLLLGRRRSR